MNKKTKIIGVIIIFLILIGGILFLIFYLQNKNKSFTYKSSKFSIEKLLIPKKEDVEELVIAVCNENVDWVDNYSKKFKLITVYNKCGRVLKFKSSNIKVIESPNIGSCDYAYLSYIIDRYDTLPDFIEFTKGWVKPTKEYHNCLPCKNQEQKFNELMKFTIYNHPFTYNKIMDKKFKWYESGYKNMNEWIKNQEFLNEELYKKNTCNLILGGHFGATKEQIIKTPKKVWEALRAQQKYPREEVDHFIERTWRPLLCKTPYKLVVVAIFKNEAVAMREWLNHYLREGVDHFYMIDNGSTDNWQSEIEEFPVTIYSDTEKAKQIDHYNNYFLEEVKRNSEWVMVVDLDEFMYSRKSYKTIPEYLDTLGEDVNQIQVRWKMFGSNGHIKQPKSMIKGFTKRHKDLNIPLCKSIIRVSTLEKFYVHSHHINTPGTIMLPKEEYNSEKELNKQPLHLNHYCIQSWEFYKNNKMTRGDVYSIDPNPKSGEIRKGTTEFFKKYDWNDIVDIELALKNYQK